MYKDNSFSSKLLEEAVDAIGTLPGIGKRGALRLALHLLRQPKENVHHLTEAINRLCDEVRYCKTCYMISDSDECSICSDRSRDHSKICVVASIRDVMSIEATDQYHGIYHVLGGIISPINGIGPSDLTIGKLAERISGLTQEGMKPSDIEVILALSGDVEGETTAFYIYRQISGFGVKVTSLARGLGFGDDLEYADGFTLGKSIQNRTEFKP
jgi:recombination protein RecR